MNAKIKLLNPALPASELAESPYWDHEKNLFYWVDITGCLIHRYNMDTEKYDSIPTPSSVGFATLDQQGALVAGLKNGLFRIGHDEKFYPIAMPDDLESACRFNDGKCDPRGRLWAGTMHLVPEKNPPSGILYCHDGTSFKTIEKDIGIANGMGWSPDGATMYFTDTGRKIIWQYDYDMSTGTASNKRVLHDFSTTGNPDGLAVDSEGRIFSAQFSHGRIDILTPDGQHDDCIRLPVPQVTSCVFGGKDFKTLFITTAASDMTTQEKGNAPFSGQVFVTTLDSPGLPCQRFKGV